MKIDNFFAELKRRNVYKVAITYAVVAWLLVQAASILLPTFEAPTWVMKALVVFLALGFGLVVFISWAFEATPEGLKRTEDVPPDVAAKLPTWSSRKFATFIVAVAVIAAGLLAYQFLRTKPASPPITAAPNTDKSIAVLPFDNATGNTDTEYLSDGISEALINSLTELQQLKVIARGTAFRYKGKDVDPQQVGRELNVQTVLMGRVRQLGDTLNIQVDLVDATTGAQLWGTEYERKLSDVLSIKQTIAHEVMDKLRLKLSGAEQQRLTKRDTTNAEAYQFYLR